MEKISITDAIERTAGNYRYQYQILFLLGICQIGFSCYILGLAFMLPDNMLGPTATTSFEFINEKDFYREIIISCCFTGIPIGSLVISWLSDRFGRKTMLKHGCLWYMVFLILATFSFTRGMLMLSAFFLGFFLNSGVSLTFIILSEVVTAKSRVFMTSILLSCWSCGLVFDSIMYELNVSWRVTLFTSAMLLLFVLLLSGHIEESPRFLLANNRRSEAEKVLNKISILNGCGDFNSSLLKEYKAETHKHSYSLLCSHGLKWNTLVASVLWLNALCMYYGMIFSGPIIGNNVYTNGRLMGIMEILAMAVNCFIGDKVPRRKIFLLAIFISRLSLGITVAISYFTNQENWALVGFFCIGRFSLSFEMYLLYLCTSELFPTYIRNMAIGYCSVIGRVGGILSSNVIGIARSLETSPILLIALLTSTSVIALYFMRETKGETLVDTVKAEKHQEMKTISSSLIKA